MMSLECSRMTHAPEILKVRVLVLAVLLILGHANSRRLGSPRRQPRMLMGVPVTIYNFPWSCWLNTEEHNNPAIFPRPFWPAPFGMCSIFTNRLVFVGVDNFRDMSLNDDYRGPNSESLTYKNVHVFWGSDNPGRPYSKQVRKSKLENLFIALTPNVDKIDANDAKGTHFTNDWRNASIQWDVIGAALNIAIAKTSNEILWTPYVLPIPLPDKGILDIKKDTELIIDYLNKHPHARDACSLASYDAKTSTAYTQVVYVPTELCRTIYCSKDLGYCFNYPYQWYHVCFRTVLLTDPCKYDQGAALYCNWWSRSVFAILSQSDNCGMDGLPAVYTVVAAPLLIYAHSGELTEKLTVPLAKRRKIDLSRYTLPPNVPTPTIFGQR